MSPSRQVMADGRLSAFELSNPKAGDPRHSEHASAYDQAVLRLPSRKKRSLRF